MPPLTKPNRIATTDKPTWGEQLAHTISDFETLCHHIALDPQTLRKKYHLPDKFRLKVPHAFADRIAKADPNDPLLKQILPTKDELTTKDGYSTDPLAERGYNPIKGLLHKYPSRVLITLTGACAVHCRYCFRQHFDYSANMPTHTAQDEIVHYINARPQIKEVIFSGGDPLNVSNRRLLDWLIRLDTDTDISIIRLHTRLPIVLPDRVDDELLQGLKTLKKKLIVVLHTNHKNEIDHEVTQACQKLSAVGVTLLNQTVLLKGVNDDVDTLCELSYALFHAGVMPYYLHLLDKVAGAAHFEVDEKTAVTLYWQLLEQLSGHLVPKLVQELPNKAHKTPVDVYRYCID